MYAGFIAPGSSCEDDPEDATMIRGNKAHSVDGEGWIVYKNQKYSD